MVLSERLRHIADMVTDGNRLADIGTDHGFVPISLIQEGRVPFAIAMDINEGPLERASQHVKDAGLEDRIILRRSDGLEALRKGEADTVLIAGMGGALTVRILKQGILPHVKPDQKGRHEYVRCTLDGSDITELVLQPQSELSKVRRFLEEIKWMITDEDMVLEDGKFYSVMKCRPGLMKLSEEEAAYGPVLLRERHAHLREYLLWQETVSKRTLESLEAAGTQRAVERASQISLELARARVILDSWS